MKCGKLAQSIYERSVIKVMKANGAGLGADCAVLAGSGNCAGILSGQAAAFGMDSRTAARAYLAATNHVIACCANSAASGLFDAYANITLMVPEKLREIKLRQMTEAAAGQAEETGIPILGCNVQVLPMVTETVAVCVISAGMKNRSESPLVPIRKQPLVDRDLVMTKWLAASSICQRGCQSKVVFSLEQSNFKKLASCGALASA